MLETLKLVSGRLRGHIVQGFRAVMSSLRYTTPLLLGALVFVPPDFGTVLFWLAGGTITIISLVRLIRYGFQREFSKMMFPALSVAMFCAALAIIAVSIDEADAYGRKTAQQIQKSCGQDQRCPAGSTVLSGWDCHLPDGMLGVACHRLYGNYGARFWVRYQPDLEMRNFVITVRHNIDRRLIIRGGVDRPLSELNEQ